jgi:YebC/PmpR family DNA-binding regulatory protein
MSGHSKWSTIKHKKAKTDAQRGKIFNRLIRELTVAARESGGDPDTNPRLRTALQRAKEANMPSDTVTRAIQRGTGELPGVTYEEMLYEGYAAGGVAMLLELVTDNRRRTAAEIRHIFSSHGGSLGEAGCVAWMFDKKGLIVIEADKVSEDEVIMATLDAGAEDVISSEGTIEVTTTMEDLEEVRNALEGAGIEYLSAEITMIPQSTVPVEGKQAIQVLKLIEDLEEHDDVQQVYSNFDISKEIMEEMSKVA